SGRHVGNDRLMDEIRVEIFAKRFVGYRDGSSRALTVGNSKLHRLIPLSLNCGADNHITARGAWHGTFDQQQVAFRIDTDNFEVLHGDALGTHVAGHLLALENATRGLVLTNRAGGAVGQGVAVGGILHAEVPALDDALKALALGDTRSEEHTSELQSRENLVFRLLPEN